MKEELSYYEYWLTKDVWEAWRAIRFIVDYYQLQRSWYISENNMAVVNAFHDKLLAEISAESAASVFTKRGGSEGYDGEGNYREYKVDVNESDVDTMKYIRWLHDNEYPLPYEFKVAIGVDKYEGPTNDKQRDMVDRELCKGIARTLWDIYPEMTIEEMIDHKAIKVYGGGRLHEIQVRRWVSAVDTRKNKRGRKKKTTV